MCVSPQKPEKNFLKLDLPFETLFGNVTLCAPASLNPQKNCFQVIFIEVHTLSTPETVRGMARVKLNVNKSNNMKYKYEVLHVVRDIQLHEYQMRIDWPGSREGWNCVKTNPRVSLSEK